VVGGGVRVVVVVFTCGDAGGVYLRWCWCVEIGYRLVKDWSCVWLQLGPVIGNRLVTDWSQIGHRLVL
jgi:hypothetical protein